jgi:hypothetical protein
MLISKPPTRTATSSTRRRDDRQHRAHRADQRRARLGSGQSGRVGLARHVSGDWGDLDAHDRALNDAALRHERGRLLSAYRLPDELAVTTSERRVWVMTDDLEDPDTVTTILWPSDY